MSAPHPDKRGALSALRTLVEEKFPRAACAPAGRLRTGCGPLDVRGGLPRGAITEVCGSLAGGQMVIASLLETAVREGFFSALIDGADAFDPAQWPDHHLDRLLWVRCGEPELALKAADVLVRDGNLPVLVLDLQAVAVGRLRRIPVGTWHRFHRVIETSATVMVTLTPFPLVESVPCRMAVRMAAVWEALGEPRDGWPERCQVQIFERGGGDIRLSA